MDVDRACFCRGPNLTQGDLDVLPLVTRSGTEPPLRASRWERLEAVRVSSISKRMTATGTLRRLRDVTSKTAKWRTDARRRIRQGDRLALVLRLSRLIQGPGNWKASTIAKKLLRNLD